MQSSGSVYAYLIFSHPCTNPGYLEDFRLQILQVAAPSIKATVVSVDRLVGTIALVDDARRRCASHIDALTTLAIHNQKPFAGKCGSDP